MKRTLSFGAALFALCFATLAHAQPLVTGDLSVYYSFDELDEDGFFLDGSGNNLHGLVTLGTEDANEDGLDDIRLETTDTWRGGGAAFFDTDAAIKEDYVAVCDRLGGYEAACDIAEDNDLIPTTGFTVAAWVKVEDVGSDHSIWQSRADGGGFIHTQVQANGNFRYRLRGDANGDNIVQFNEPPGGELVEFEEWIHYAGTYEKAEGADFGEWAIYFNGEEVAGGEANGSVAGTEFEVLGNWGQGAFIGLVPDFNRQLVGLIDEFYLFRRALTPDEIQTLTSSVDPLDLNADGSIDVADVDAVADFDGSGTADVDDRVAYLLAAFNTYLGDSNLDGEFSSGDLVQVFVAGKYETGEAATYAEGDWDGDNMFGSGDLVAAFVEGGYEVGPRAATAAVPEPASMALFSVGLIALLARRRVG